MITQPVTAVLSCLFGGLSIALLADISMTRHEQQQFKSRLLGRVIDEIREVPAEHKSAIHSETVNRRGEPFSRLTVYLNRLPLINRLAQKQTKNRHDSELAMLLDITALGMQSGMSFDQAFELSLQRLPGYLAEICLAKLSIWQKGLITREQGLRELEEQVGTVLFSRFVSLILRALRYGAPMNQLLLTLSDEARRVMRARREEEVAKAPIKMLVPTGTLILPAMLLMVLGPIMLDLMEKM
jgi:tight adherence protein C